MKIKWQYSIRFLLIATAMIAIAIGLLVNVYRHHLRKLLNEQYWQNAGFIAICNDKGNVEQLLPIMSNSGIFLSAIREISGLQDLEYLDLQGVTVIDRELALIQLPTSIQGLKLNRTKISDGAIKNITTKLTALKYLYIRDTNVSDQSIGDILRIKSLLAIDVRGTNISEDGVKKLKREMKDIEIFSDF